MARPDAKKSLRLAKRFVLAQGGSLGQPDPGDPRLYRQFDNFGEALDYCREVGHSVVVIINGERWKLYRSGRAERKGD